MQDQSIELLLNRIESMIDLIERLKDENAGLRTQNTNLESQVQELNRVQEQSSSSKNDLEQENQELRW